MELIKSLSLYRIKDQALEELVMKCIIDNIDEFSVKQLEILMWSMAR